MRDDEASFGPEATKTIDSFRMVLMKSARNGIVRALISFRACDGDAVETDPTVEGDDSGRTMFRRAYEGYRALMHDFVKHSMRPDSRHLHILHEFDDCFCLSSGEFEIHTSFSFNE